MATVNLGRIKPIWQGNYASETSYVVDDMVLYNNSAYICTAASQGNAPTNTSYWDLMTQGSNIPTQTGNSGKVLKTDGSTLSWGTGSKVLQVVNMSTQTETNTTSTSFIDTALTANITPSSINNKIIILCTTSIYCSQNGFTALTIAKNGTNLGHGTYGFAWGKSFYSQWMSPAAINYTDSADSTSQITYTIQLRSQESGHTSYININGARGGLTLLEIDGN